jgi:hypothetical protein
MREPANKHHTGPQPGVAAGQEPANATGANTGNGQDESVYYPADLLKSIPNGTIFAYNMDESKTAGGMRVRWKIRVVTGPEAARWDARQVEAIREALQWAHQHLPPAGTR